MTDEPFIFEGCDSPSVCREALRPLLASGMDWSEVQCGRCGKRGIVRHDDLDGTASDSSPEPASPTDADLAPVEAEDTPTPHDKGRNR